MSIKKTVKLTLLASTLATMMSLTGCDKKVEEAPEPEINADVPMSADPAENNEPAIVADDLDEVDAQLKATETDLSAENSDNTDITVIVPEAKSVEATESEQQAPAH